MKDFSLDEYGDIVIFDNDIKYIDDKSLTAQKIKVVLGTHKGEDLFNRELGIDYSVILTKNPEEDKILDAILDGLRQVDETMSITDHEYRIEDRKLYLKLYAKSEKADGIAYSIETSSSSPTDLSWIIRALEDLVEVQ